MNALDLDTPLDRTSLQETAAAARSSGAIAAPGRAAAIREVIDHRLRVAVAARLGLNRVRLAILGLDTTRPEGMPSPPTNLLREPDPTMLTGPGAFQLVWLKNGSPTVDFYVEFVRGPNDVWSAETYADWS